MNHELYFIPQGILFKNNFIENEKNLISITDRIHFDSKRVNESILNGCYEKCFYEHSCLQFKVDEMGKCEYLRNDESCNWNETCIYMNRINYYHLKFYKKIYIDVK